MTVLTRRTFAAAAVALPARKTLAANDRPGIALIGCGGRGLRVTKYCLALGNLVACSDVDSTHLAAGAALAPGAFAHKDFRRVLERKDVDIVINATPDHWHTLINIAALKAGKDVYSEKPLTLTIEEGRRLVNTARTTGRILQTGSQQRSDPRFRAAVELVRGGRIGQLNSVVVGLPKASWGGPFQAQPVPSELDWDFYQGQAPKRDYLPERTHFRYRHWYDYCSGPLTDWGCHHNDIMLWALGMDHSGPVSVQGVSHLDPVPGGYDVHSQFTVQYRFASGPPVTCVTMYTEQFGKTPLVVPSDMICGIKFAGTQATLRVDRGMIECSRPELLPEIPQVNSERAHIENFFECVRSRKEPLCPPEVGHRAASFGHLGSICLRLGGRPLRWDPDKERFIGDAEANRYVAREQRKPYSYEKL
ncbi:MAG: Gfo/Idh/MocA family oxidoreductase [Acidobacteria bacterium]|nr:Gfo/Idh/MocA family oxidoreductase [Acidobacteriota bacterium]